MSARKLGALLLGMSLTACNPDISEPGVCESYGVRELGRTMGNLVERPATLAQVQDVCGPVAGCVKVDGNMASAWYLQGDGCLRQHEICHVEHGEFHTVRYTQRLIRGDVKPACPQ